MAKGFVTKKVLKLRSVSAQIHPAVDVAAIIYSLAPGYRIPVHLLRDKAYVDIRYRYRDVEITGTRSLLVVGPKEYVDERLAGYKMIVSTDHNMNEELARIMNMADRVIDMFPQLLLIIGQIVPHTSLAVFMERLKDWMPKGYSIRLEPLVRVLGGLGYHEVLTLVDMDRDKSLDSVERLFLGVVASHDVTSLVVVANAPRIIEVLPSKVKEYVTISFPLGGSGEREEGK